MVRNVQFLNKFGVQVDMPNLTTGAPDDNFNKYGTTIVEVDSNPKRLQQRWTKLMSEVHCDFADIVHGGLMHLHDLRHEMDKEGLEFVNSLAWTLGQHRSDDVLTEIVFNVVRACLTLSQKIQILPHHLWSHFHCGGATDKRLREAEVNVAIREVASTDSVASVVRSMVSRLNRGNRPMAPEQMDVIKIWYALANVQFV